MIASDLAQRYAQGESLRTLAQDYHLDKRTVAKTVRAMGGVIRPAGGGHRGQAATRAAIEMRRQKAHARKLAAGLFCRRCEILLEFDPGRDGLCGECMEEVRDDPRF